MKNQRQGPIAKRPTISKGLRFRVFMRDRFTCQYCGRTAPYFPLHVDHIEPLSRGGKHAMSNFATACQECNSGKHAVEGTEQLISEKRMDESAAFSIAYEQHWGPEVNEIEDNWPQSIYANKVRGPIRFDFDVYDAAAELAPACPPLPLVDLTSEPF